MSGEYGTPAGPESTFVFADIAGFTALTEAHGDEDAADLALDFGQRVRAVLPIEEGEVVKTIGDALMVRLRSPSFAVRLGSVIAHEVMSDHGQPTVRVGMHMGPASERAGDFFGATVNLAARIAASARGGEVLCSEAVRRNVGEADGMRFVSRGPHRLHNVTGSVVLYSIEQEEPRSRAVHLIDPVCRMIVTPGREIEHVDHQGVVYLFCSEPCAARFRACPENYVAPS